MRFNKLLWVLALAFFAVSTAFAAPAALGAVSGANARTQTTNDAAARMGAGSSGSGPGADLRAIATRRQPTTATGLPPGFFDGSGGGAGTQAPSVEGKAVFSGEPLPPFIGPEMAGAPLDRVFVVAAHAGYTVVNRAFTPNSLDSAYTFDVMSGRARKARVHCDLSLKVLWVEN